MAVNEVNQIFQLKPKDVVSIVGAGGKTSLMFYLANHLSGRVIVGTSTKILQPGQAYKQYINEPIQWQASSEVIVTSKAIQNGKLVGINPYVAQASYDFLLIEADGSRTLPLKGWGPLEPVIIEATTVTIGVVDITSLGMKVTEDNIFRLEALSKLTHLGPTITVQNLIDIIEHKEGLFKRSQGRRILYINKIEDQQTKLAAEALCHRLKPTVVDQIVIGSVNNQTFESIRVGK